jgi:transcription elongation factor Elf1
MSRTEPRQIAPHDWKRVGGKLEVRCPECGGMNNSQYKLDEQNGTLELFCYTCSEAYWVELVGWVGPPSFDESLVRGVR